LGALKGLPAPDILASPLRRARLLAKLLTDDKRGAAFLPGAGSQLTHVLNKRLDGLAAELDGQVRENVEDIETAEVRRTKVSPHGAEIAEGTRSIAAHDRDVDRDTRKVIRSIREGAGQDYYAHCVEEAGPDADKLDVRTRVAALLILRHRQRITCTFSHGAV
jgi:hypothetical protein